MIDVDHLCYLAQENGYVVDMGQFSLKEKRQLDKRVKTGELIKAKLAWPRLYTGTCMKTFYINKQPL